MNSDCELGYQRVYPTAGAYTKMNRLSCELNDATLNFTMK